MSNVNPPLKANSSNEGDLGLVDLRVAVRYIEGGTDL